MDSVLSRLMAPDPNDSSAGAVTYRDWLAGLIYAARVAAQPELPKWMHVDETIRDVAGLAIALDKGKVESVIKGRGLDDPGGGDTHEPGGP